MTTRYVLITELKRQLNSNATDATDVLRLQDWAEQASAWVEQVCNRRFDRYVDTRQFSPALLTYGGDLFSSVELLLDVDLIELLTDPGYRLEPVNAADGYARVYSEDGFDLNDDDLIEVDGVWGWGGSFSEVELLTEELTAVATTITVVSSTAYQEYMLLRIDDELLNVTELTDATTITVERGHNGSTAAIHAIGASVTKFTADPLVQRLTVRYVQWLEATERSPTSMPYSPMGDIAVPSSSGVGPPDAIFIALYQGLKRSARPLAL